MSHASNNKNNQRNGIPLPPKSTGVEKKRPPATSATLGARRGRVSDGATATATAANPTTSLIAQLESIKPLPTRASPRKSPRKQPLKLVVHEPAAGTHKVSHEHLAGSGSNADADTDGKDTKSAAASPSAAVVAPIRTSVFTSDDLSSFEKAEQALMAADPSLAESENEPLVESDVSDTSDDSQPPEQQQDGEGGGEEEGREAMDDIEQDEDEAERRFIAGQDDPNEQQDEPESKTDDYRDSVDQQQEQQEQQQQEGAAQSDQQPMSVDQVGSMGDILDHIPYIPPRSTQQPAPPTDNGNVDMEVSGQEQEGQKPEQATDRDRTDIYQRMVDAPGVYGSLYDINANLKAQLAKAQQSKAAKNKNNQQGQPKAGVPSTAPPAGAPAQKRMVQGILPSATFIPPHSVTDSAKHRDSKDAKFVEPALEGAQFDHAYAISQDPKYEAFEKHFENVPTVLESMVVRHKGKQAFEESSQKAKDLAERLKMFEETDPLTQELIKYAHNGVAWYPNVNCFTVFNTSDEKRNKDEKQRQLASATALKNKGNAMFGSAPVLTVAAPRKNAKRDAAIARAQQQGGDGDYRILRALNQYGVFYERQYDSPVCYVMSALLGTGNWSGGNTVNEFGKARIEYPKAQLTQAEWQILISSAAWDPKFRVERRFIKKETGEEVIISEDPRAVAFFDWQEVIRRYFTMRALETGSISKYAGALRNTIISDLQENLEPDVFEKRVQELEANGSYLLRERIVDKLLFGEKPYITARVRMSKGGQRYMVAQSRMFRFPTASEKLAHERQAYKPPTTNKLIHKACAEFGMMLATPEFLDMGKLKATQTRVDIKPNSGNNSNSSSSSSSSSTTTATTALVAPKKNRFSGSLADVAEKGLIAETPSIPFDKIALAEGDLVTIRLVDDVFMWSPQRTFGMKPTMLQVGVYAQLAVPIVRTQGGFGGGQSRYNVKRAPVEFSGASGTVSDRRTDFEINADAEARYLALLDAEKKQADTAAGNTSNDPKGGGTVDGSQVEIEMNGLGRIVPEGQQYRQQQQQQQQQQQEYRGNDQYTGNQPMVDDDQYQSQPLPPFSTGGGRVGGRQPQNKATNRLPAQNNGVYRAGTVISKGVTMPTPPQQHQQGPPRQQQQQQQPQQRPVQNGQQQQTGVKRVRDPVSNSSNDEFALAGPRASKMARV